MNLTLLADIDLLINLVLLFQKKLSIKEAIFFSVIVFLVVEAYYYWKNKRSESE
ncbi:hypothetical protein [Acidianus bottle-shaped virus 2 strain ABV2]|uniref:Uncharacterized protein n=1 Tax=Acidianus bottle-shaped virus 2 strain ABV2 TaxID=1732173 RepID=A0A0N9PCK0_9VIRU|nr:hypothetical protein AVU01_gp10 [Acidianus bottle-shaped virus 2 strain ABV2]ALG96758.1 hypothetical protein [Acidianus bottle-shaped virus 2 strain ABV2]